MNYNSKMYVVAVCRNAIAEPESSYRNCRKNRFIIFILLLVQKLIVALSHKTCLLPPPVLQWTVYVQQH